MISTLPSPAAPIPATRSVVARPVVRAARRSRVNPVLRMALYLFVASIPFEMPNRTIPLEIPTLMGFVLLGATILNPTAAYRKIPPAVIWFGTYLWIAVALVILHHVEHPMLAARYLVNLTQMLLVFWVTFNLLRDERVLRGVLIALVTACAIRAALQVFGIADTPRQVWTGGERITALGQNANLSAMILSAGLVATLGLQAGGERRLPRLRLLTWPIAVLLVIAIIQTGSRTGLLCAGLGLLVFLFRGRTPALRVRNVTVGVLALGFLVWGASHSAVMRGRMEEAERGRLAGRERIYPEAIGMFVERPLLGWGIIDNQYEIARRIDERGRVRRDVHNLGLELLTSSGAIGAFPFLVGLALCLRGAWRARKGRLGILPLALLLAVLAGTIPGTWLLAKIVWLALAFALAAGAHWSRRRFRPAEGPA